MQNIKALRIEQNSETIFLPDLFSSKIPNSMERIYTLFQPDLSTFESGILLYYEHGTSFGQPDLGLW